MNRRFSPIIGPVSYHLPYSVRVFYRITETDIKNFPNIGEVRMP